MHFPDSIVDAVALNTFAEMLRKHYDASGSIRFESTGSATPLRSPALVDLVGDLPGTPPE